MNLLQIIKVNRPGCYLSATTTASKHWVNWLHGKSSWWKIITFYRRWCHLLPPFGICWVSSFMISKLVYRYLLASCVAYNSWTVWPDCYASIELLIHVPMTYYGLPQWLYNNPGTLKCKEKTKIGFSYILGLCKR